MIRKWFLIFMTLIFAVFPFIGHSKAGSEDFDILVKNGRIVDGTGNPWFYADIGIKGETIVAGGRLAEKTAAKRKLFIGKCDIVSYYSMFKKEVLINNYKDFLNLSKKEIRYV